MITDIASRLTRNVTLCMLACALARLASAQATLRITSPTDGTIVRPGQSVTVRVAAFGEMLKGAFMIGGAPIGFGLELLAAPPYNFTIEIPKEIKSGTYNLTADGFTASRHEVKKDIVTIDVERADSPLELRLAEFTYFRVHVGETTFSRIMGLFADGTTADLMQSTLTTFRSDNVGVATVGRFGLVKGVAPGFARITITNEHAKVEVPVIVLRNDEE